MKIAILSDIHGNIDAFREVIKQMKKQNIDVVFSLGDHLGYYHDAIEVFSEMKKWKHHVISGNHERIFLKFLKSKSKYKEKITAKYGTCYSKYEQEFSKELIEEMANLPEEKIVEIDGYKFLLCHGSPLDKDQYIYPDCDKKTLKNCDLNAYDFIFMGHTHYPMIYKGNSTLVINVGSIGQARTTGGIANWGVFNTANGVYTPQSTPYNINALENSLIGKEKEYLHNVLRRNNSTL